MPQSLGLRPGPRARTLAMVIDRVGSVRWQFVSFRFGDRFGDVEAGLHASCEDAGTSQLARGASRYNGDDDDETAAYLQPQAFLFTDACHIGAPHSVQRCIV
eukprot:CAMPEP_0195082562 /NCGR_PEP_ID=MMETSP0448-20130528/23723_1 /TAXON_ID=66468 /ORGANISM="Heterocapsa triquestra, Strain CCMP 448" /LENGTH=101 /DNA_ID=CAMNT_0040115687 /DNA_START=14 /DNA_END=319 /DNA_ORIENTATION=-